jgi:hypothetical protein
LQTSSRLISPCRSVTQGDVDATTCLLASSLSPVVVSLLQPCLSTTSLAGLRGVSAETSDSSSLPTFRPTVHAALGTSRPH